MRSAPPRQMMGTLPHDDRAALTSAQERITGMIASGAPLRETLEELVRVVEEASSSGMLASILVLDEARRHLLHGAGPSLPDTYNAAINGIEIGPEVGSCGTAAFHDKTVSVFDIANDRRWANFKDLALQYGLRACWSTPIHGADGKVLGTFANYYRIVRDPSPADRTLTEMITRTAAMAIEQDRRASLAVSA
jgi:GAF domain-containing protein